MKQVSLGGLDVSRPGPTGDLEPGVADLPGVAVIGLDTLVGHGTAAGDDDIAVRAILDSELAAHQSAVDGGTR